MGDICCLYSFLKYFIEYQVLAMHWQGQWEQNRVPSVITEVIAKGTSNVLVMATAMQPVPGSLAIPDLVYSPVSSTDFLFFCPSVMFL